MRNEYYIFKEEVSDFDIVDDPDGLVLAEIEEAYPEGAASSKVMVSVLDEQDGEVAFFVHSGKIYLRSLSEMEKIIWRHAPEVVMPLLNQQRDRIIWLRQNMN